MTLKTVTISRGQRQVFDQGEGDVLLFAHGFPLDHRMWSEQLSEFSQSYRVVAPDLCGFGGSESVGTEEVLTMKHFADELVEILEALNVTHPVHLIGLSMGGYIAGQFLKNHSPQLKSLTLCDTRSEADGNDAKQNRHKTARLVLEAGSQPLAETMGSKLFGPNTPESILNQIRTMITDASPAGIAAASRGMAERSAFTDTLRFIDVPSLVVVGEYDSISTPAEMRGIAEQIPNATFVEISQAGHMSPLENPQEFNAGLAEFLNRIENHTASN